MNTIVFLVQVAIIKRRGYFMINFSIELNHLLDIYSFIIKDIRISMKK